MCDNFCPDSSSITGNPMILCTKLPSICPQSIVDVGCPFTDLYSISYSTGCLTMFKFIIGANSTAMVNHALTLLFKARIQPRSDLKLNQSWTDLTINLQPEHYACRFRLHWALIFLSQCQKGGIVQSSMSDSLWPVPTSQLEVTGRLT